MDRLPAALTAVAFALSLTIPVRAQTSTGGARDAALIGASAAATADLWAEANPAGWSELRSFSAAVHAAQFYGLDELRLGAFQFALNVRATALILGARTFGYDDYRETVLTTGIGRTVHWGTFRPLHAGVRLRHHRIGIPAYGSASSTALSAGFVLPILPQTKLGVAAENIVLSGSLRGELPRRLYSALAVEAGAVTLHAAASKDVRSPLQLRFGLELEPIDVLALRAGYSFDPARFAGGAGLRLPPLTIDMAAERHLILGWSPSCSVSIQW